MTTSWVESDEDMEEPSDAGTSLLVADTVVIDDECGTLIDTEEIFACSRGDKVVAVDEPLSGEKATPLLGGTVGEVPERVPTVLVFEFANGSELVRLGGARADRAVMVRSVVVVGLEGTVGWTLSGGSFVTEVINRAKKRKLVFVIFLKKTKINKHT